MTVQQEKADKVRQVLEGQRFADWYTTGNFDNYIRVDYPECHPKHVNKDQIIKEIISLFHL